MSPWPEQKESLQSQFSHKGFSDGPTIQESLGGCGCSLHLSPTIFPPPSATCRRLGYSAHRGRVGSWRCGTIPPAPRVAKKCSLSECPRPFHRPQTRVARRAGSRGPSRAARSGSSNLSDRRGLEFGHLIHRGVGEHITVSLKGLGSPNPILADVICHHIKPESFWQPEGRLLRAPSGLLAHGSDGDISDVTELHDAGLLKAGQWGDSPTRR